jgi:hypothetical protein
MAGKRKRGRAEGKGERSTGREGEREAEQKGGRSGRKTDRQEGDRARRRKSVRAGSRKGHTYKCIGKEGERATWRE